MAQYNLLLPKMGESVAEATIIKWLKQPGDFIKADESVLEIATDKVDSDVPSPVSGKLIKQLFNENDVVQVGDVICLIETEVGESSKDTENAIETKANDPAPIEQAIPGILQLQEFTPTETVAKHAESSRFYSPLVKSIAAEEGIDLKELDSLQGSGGDGRVTKQDLLDYLKSRSSKVPESENFADTLKGETAPKPAEKAQEQKTFASPVSSISGADEIIEMDRMGKLIAEHMVMSKHTSAHVTSFVEADVTSLVKWRDKIKSTFEKREGEKITFTPIFIEAVAKAIKDMPMINVSLNGNQIIKKKDINIGMAAALPSGNLIVPVIKNADQLNLLGLTKSVNDLANRARVSKLKPEETQGGTFTVTNVGTFGNVMGTPIINQPQVAILAIGAIKKKPAVIETPLGDVIAIRHMMFLSLSYDHRVVNGALGGSFVKKVADYLEAWDVNRSI
ncbi:MAG: Diapophytoene dehydrogenase [Daejeonella sp.]|nr:Diapophytoene dehydrogenase [Daejeonella sp.]